jgi:hypothetical protein
MAFRFFRLRQKVEVIATTEPEQSAVPQRKPPSGFSALMQVIGSVVLGVFGALDDGLCWLAVPFGVRIAHPLRRYALMLGLYAVIYVLGALRVGYLPLVALGFGYVGVLAIGRAWVRNEKKRTAIVKKLAHGDPDKMPDLRWTALVSALQLIVLFPLLYQQVQWHFQLFKVHDNPTFGDWLWFSLDKTYLKALPDWSILYGIHISSIDFDAPWGRHLVLLSRLTFDYILIQGVLRLLAIRLTIREAVAAVKADPEMAVRLGKRAVAPLIEKLYDPDRAVRGAAANALMQLGETEALARVAEAGKE